MLSNLLQPKQRQVEVECTQCKRSVKLERCTKQRKLSHGVMDVGILCPHCDHWTHSFYETAEVKRLRAQLDTWKNKPGVRPDEVKAAQAFFEAGFKIEQERVKASLAV